MTQTNFLNGMDTHLCIHANILTMQNKDVGLRIRLQKELREEFQNACAAENRAASDVLREFMRNYADHHSGGKQTNLFALPERLNNQTTKRK